MKNMDSVLYDALSPMEEPSINLNRKILNANKEINMNRIIPIKRRSSFSAAAAILATVLAFSSVTAYAAWKYLSAQDVATVLSDQKLAKNFGSENLLAESETQHFKNYDITLLGLVSGKDLSERISTYNGAVISDSTYAAVAISKADGSPMPETSSDEYSKEDFLVSPYIEGFDPAKYNVLSFNAGGYSSVVENGVQYRIMEVESIEAFADHRIYLGVSDGTFYNSDAYIYDANTGKITRNAEYDGVNALFALPIDAAKADQNKANAILEKIENHTNEDDDPYQFATADAEEFMSKLTVDNIDKYAEPVESTRQVLSPDKDGYINYEYVMPSGDSGTGLASVENLFPDGITGMSDKFGWSSSEDGLKSLWIETYTLNEDGTVTFVIYVPKK